MSSRHYPSRNDARYQHDLSTNRNGSRYQNDQLSNRNHAKFRRRRGCNDYRPQYDHKKVNDTSIDTLMGSISTLLKDDVKPTPVAPTGWWEVSIQQAATIGKDRVMSTLKAHCTRPFQPYHYFIDLQSKGGVFFVNNQHDADMIKRMNGKIEVQSIDILRIMVKRARFPKPSLDEDLRPYLKDHLFNHRFNHQTFQLDLTNLADDEGLSSLGIFPQFNRQAFIHDVVDIINKHFPTTRKLDLGSNNIVDLSEFRNLHLNNLELISFASNKLRNAEDFGNLKQLPHLAHILIKNNPLTNANNNQTKSIEDIHSIIHQKLPQLKRIDESDLQPRIGFGTDIEQIILPKSLPHYVPDEMSSTLTNFIQFFYPLFDAPGREELHNCYDDSCMFSLCITTSDNTVVPTRQYKYGELMYSSRNLKKVADLHKRVTLLQHGKSTVLNFLQHKFPMTKHDGNSFRVDVISTTNNRLMFTINGLFTEVNQTANSPVRCFQRTFTCTATPAGLRIIADHIMLNNATDAQFLKMTRSTVSPTSSQTTTHSQASANSDANRQQQAMVERFSQQSTMNIQFSKDCLEKNNWNYDAATANFLSLNAQNMLPAEAFR